LYKTLLAGFYMLTVALFFGFSTALAQDGGEEQLETGARLFQENCSVCHGPNGEGRVGATLAQNWPSIRPDLLIRDTIERGIPGSVMPAWGEEHGGPLSNEEIDALVAYIQSWQTGGQVDPSIFPSPTPHPPIEPIPEVEGDPNRGASIYAENCAVCHGPNGEGRAGATLAKAWPSVRPDLNVKAVVSQGIPGSIMPAWHQDNGGPLSEAEIDDVTAFVLSRQDESVQQVNSPNDPAEAQQEVSQTTAPWLRSWPGVLLFLVLLVVIVAGALIAQRRS
jgi:mono/diheme cytochrome c family protein